MLTTATKNAYVSILREELIHATGCTEPIVLAYAAARLRDILGGNPERIRAEISGNIIKNVKSVVVPNTGGMKGIGRLSAYCGAVSAGVRAGAGIAYLLDGSYGAMIKGLFQEPGCEPA